MTGRSDVTPRRVVRALVAAVLLAPWPHAARAQAPAATARLGAPVSAADSVAVLTFADFDAAVRARHPVVRQALLLERAAGAELLGARAGLYDPVLSATWDRKGFKGTEYFNYLDVSLKVPTPVGLDLKLGYQDTRGAYVNPDRTTPGAGLLKAGVVIPLGQGILTDQRRTAVAQAAALRDVAAGERRATVNKLLLSAAKEYAGWYEAWRRLAIAREGVTLAETRARWVARRAEDGDAAPIDTVEAALELLRRRAAALEAANAYYGQTQRVSAFLWDEGGAGLDVAPGVVPSAAGLGPVALDTARVDEWLRLAVREHPDVVKALGKLREARAGRTLAAQDLLPDATLELSALKAGGTGLLGDWPDAGDNYALGLSVKSPLLLMKERGKLGAARAKAESQALELERARREVRLAVLAAVNDVVTFDGLLAVQRAAVAAAGALRDGEARRFEAGESTLFLVNQRERQLLDEAAKLAGYEGKYAAAVAALGVALGEPATLPAPAAR